VYCYEPITTRNTLLIFSVWDGKFLTCGSPQVNSFSLRNPFPNLEIHRYLLVYYLLIPVEVEVVQDVFPIQSSFMQHTMFEVLGGDGKPMASIFDHNCNKG
jgi:hypothetical protein